jgi:hypothetical protein
MEDMRGEEGRRIVLFGVHYLGEGGIEVDIIHLSIIELY